MHYVGKIFQKLTIFNPLIRTRPCACQAARNVNFSENFAHVLNGFSLTKAECKSMDWITS